MCSGAQELASDGTIKPPDGYTWTSAESFADAGSPAVLRESGTGEPAGEPTARHADAYSATGAAAASSVQTSGPTKHSHAASAEGQLRDTSLSLCCSFTCFCGDNFQPQVAAIYTIVL